MRETTQREIRFRAWNPEIKKMSKPFGFNHVMDFTNAEGLGYVKTITNEILMQFTGLHDKNGVEIYEGDILSDSGEICYVVYQAPEFALKYHYEDFLQTIDTHFSAYEILGNIYQHPHLISNPPLTV